MVVSRTSPQFSCYGEEYRRSSNYWLQLICNRKREKFNLTNLFNTQNNMYSHFRFWNSYQDILKYNTKFTKYYSKINHTMFTTISLTWQQNPLNSFTWQFFSNRSIHKFTQDTKLLSSRWTQYSQNYPSSLFSYNIQLDNSSPQNSRFQCTLIFTHKK